MSDQGNHPPRPRVDEIRGVTAAYFSMTKADMLGPSRKRALARPRQIAMALTRELTGLSLPKIGKHFGGRDHTTVLHATRRIRTLEEQDAALELDVSRIRQAVFRLVQPDMGERPGPFEAETFLRRIAQDKDALGAIFGRMKGREIAARNRPIPAQIRNVTPIFVQAAA